ncbi:HORMA domain-containing protein 1-like [Saccostrea echinata]|uniref:HORMA domain-containing protein 1-like n=1 Tax=Saccostrea echinata TaxID=191078 RepID=UPI002A800900|nr:HORMA domain-containing protein 1-like [Saccostrea echinata]
MATTQCQREKTKDLTGIFPNETVTEQKSILFVKKLLAVAVSNIAYLRALFPEHAFGDRSIEDLHLKTLRDDSACPGVCKFIQYMKGCFDALDKKYLRILILGLYRDPENPETLIESYTFKFSYADETGVDIYRNNQKISSANTASEIKKATIRLLRTIVVLTQTMNAIPEDTMLTMKLLYYDEVTPPEYEPPGFKPSTCTDFKYEEEPVTINVGDVATPFHRIKMRVKTNEAMFDIKEEEIAEMKTDAEVHTDTEKNENIKKDESQPTPVVPTESPEIPGSDGKAVEMLGSEMSQMTETEEEFGVRCPCGCNEDDGLMVLCAICKYWQHGLCFCIKEEYEAPEHHVCDVCADKDDPIKQPTDPYLYKLSPIAIQTTCLYRRALMATTESSRVVAPSLAKRLGVEVNIAHGLIDRMEKEGYVKNSGKGKKLGKMVDNEKIMSEGLEKYLINKTVITNQENKMEEIQDIDSTEKHIEKITDMTEDMELGEQKKRRKKKLGPISEVRQSPRLLQKKPDDGKDSQQIQRKGKKRACSKIYENSEFEIADSQDVTVDEDYPRSKKKASDVSKAIMV